MRRHVGRFGNYETEHANWHKQPVVIDRRTHKPHKSLSASIVVAVIAIGALFVGVYLT